MTEDNAPHEELESNEAESPTKQGIWCLIANVAPEGWHGTTEEGRLERGTKHFSPNTKVYCYYGTSHHGSDSTQVLGRHRGSSRLVTMIVANKFLTNWRAKVVYDPYVIKKLGKGWEREVAEAWAKWQNFDEKVRHAKTNGFDTLDADTALLYAAYLGSVPRIAAALERGANVNARDEEERTPLLHAVSTHRLAALELLLDHGADINAQNKRGWTPLLIAMSHRRENSVQLLVLRGADKEMQADDGTTVYSLLEDPHRWMKPNMERALLFPRIVMGYSGIVEGYNRFHQFPFIRDSRVLVETILEKVKANITEQEILAEFPQLDMDDIEEALRYAEWVSRSNLPTKS